MQPDDFGEYLVQSLYFDTDNWDVIRASIEKPVYKEKLRIRCYGIPDAASSVFLELKKKYKSTVHKRRVMLLLGDLQNKSARDIMATDNTQIGRELNYYLNSHNVYEKVHISYNRLAFTTDNGLRITLDKNIHFRTNQLDYNHPQGGLEILPANLTIMEVKTLGGMPLWLSYALSQHGIFPTSFSKYGVGYKKHVLPVIQKDGAAL